MSGLVEFLKARLDEDEQIARAARESYFEIETLGQFSATGDMRHVMRHDPARVAAEVEAKRQIIAEHFPVDPCDAHDGVFTSILCPTLRLLALPYAGHDDYDEAWRP